MKIACIIEGNAPTVFFANRVHRAFPVSLTVIERPPPPAGSPSGRILRPFREHGPLGGATAVCAKVARRLERRFLAVGGPQPGGAGELCQRFFADDWRAPSEGMPILEDEGRKIDRVHEALRELAPDVLLIHGGPIVKKKIVATAGTALNLHWGLSPYYRGGRCTEWALLHWDPFNIGVTIHVPTREVDGGGVVAQARAKIGPGDTVDSINMQLTVLGTGLVLEILRLMSEGWRPRPRPQDLASGQVTASRQWSNRLDHEVRMLERDGRIAEMLRRPSRRDELPIVELEGRSTKPVPSLQSPPI